MFSKEINQFQLRYWEKNILLILSKIILKFSYTGEENIPTDGGAILACNHQSLLDGVLINLVAMHKRKRVVRFLAAEEYYKNSFFSHFLKQGESIPIKRGEDEHSAILKAIRTVKEGRIVGIFPEGTRTRDGKIGKGKKGVAVIATFTEKSVIPCAIKGANIAWPVNAKIFKPAKVSLIFGKPLTFSRIEKPRIFETEKITEEIMNSISNLFSSL